MNYNIVDEQLLTIKKVINTLLWFMLHKLLQIINSVSYSH